MHAKVYLLHTAWQWSAVWDSINSDLQSEGDHSQRQGNQFSSLEISSQTATTAQMTQPVAVYRYVAGMPFSPSPLKALARLETSAGSSCLLFCCALWYAWKLLTPFCLPKASLPPPSSSPTYWKWPPHPPQCKDKVQGLAGWHVGRKGDLPHLAILSAVTLPPLENNGMGLFGGFSSGLCHTPGYHWQNRTETQHTNKRYNIAVTTVTMISLYLPKIMRTWSFPSTNVFPNLVDDVTMIYTCKKGEKSWNMPKIWAELHPISP